jgi:apolipoprotein N-acyltransferase
MIDPLEEGYIVDDIAVVKTPTLYMQIGNLFVCLCILFVALVGGIGMLLRRRGLPDLVGRPRAGVKIKE